MQTYNILNLILTMPLYYLYIFATVLLFTTLFNIPSSKKQKFIYISIVGTLSFTICNFIQTIYISFIYVPLIIILRKYIFKTSFLKSTLSQFVLMLLEFFIFKLLFSIFNISTNLQWLVTICETTYIFINYLIIKHLKFNIHLENINKKKTLSLILITCLGFGAMFFQVYCIFHLEPEIHLITLFSLLDSFAYFVLLIDGLSSTNKIESAHKQLVEFQLYNQTVTQMYDKVKGFKHDFNNIIQSIGGYIGCEDFDGLKKYYNQLLVDCNCVNNLSLLDPSIINNPAIYNLVANTYYKATQDHVQMNITVLADLNEISTQMSIYEFTKILGILLDNAREAAMECDKKIVNLIFKKETTRNRIVIIVENTYKDKEIDINKIFQKSFSTKSQKTNSGFGLWEVREILNRNNNLNLFTNKNDDLFIQQLEIYF